MESSKAGTIKKRGFFKRAFRLLGRFFVFLLLLLLIFSVILIGISQTESFQNYTASKISDIVNSEINAKLQLKRVEFSSFSSINIRGVNLLVAGDTLAYADLVSIKLNFAPLLEQTVKINEIILKKPKIKLLGLKDSTWNYDYIAKPSDKPAPTDGPPSPWKLDLRKIKLQDAYFVRYDSVKSHPSNGVLDYEGLVVDSIGLEMAAFIQPGKPLFKIDIKNFTGREMLSGLKVQELAFKYRMDTTGLYVDDLKAMTEKSEIGMNYSMSGWNPFGDSTENNPMNSELSLEFELEKFDSREVHYFAEIPVKLGAEYSGYGKIGGGFDTVLIEEIFLETDNSDFSLRGRLNSLSEAEGFSYEMNFDGTNIYRPELNKFLANIDFSAVPDFGKIRFEKFYAYGTSDSSFVDVKFISGLGSLAGKAGVGFSGEELTYSGDLKVKNLNLAKVLFDRGLESNLNAEIVFQGSGVEPKSMKNELLVTSENSVIFDIPYKKLKTKAAFSGNGNFSIDTIDINFPEKISGKDNYLAFSGNVNFNKINPEYSIKSEYFSLNLSEILKNPKLPQYMTGIIKADMSGFHPDSISGNFYADFQETMFLDRALMPNSIDLNIKRDNLSREIVIKSEFFDGELSGEFSFTELGKNIGLHAEAISGYFIDKIEMIIPTNDTIATEIDIAENKITGLGNLKGEFRGKINDLTFVNIFLDSIDIASDIGFGLAISSDSTNGKIQIDSLNMEYLDVSLPGTDLKGNKLKLRGIIDLVIRDSVPEFNSFNLTASSVSNFYVNDLLIEEPFFYSDFYADSAEFNISALIDRSIGFYVDGAIIEQNQNFRLDLSQLRLNYIDEYDWYNIGDIILDFYPNGLEISKFHMYRDSAESIYATGEVFDNFYDGVNLRIYNFPLKSFLRLMPEESRKGLSSLGGKLDSLNFSINGDVDSPEAELQMTVDSLEFNNFFIGNIKSDFTNSKGIMNGYLDLLNPRIPSENKLLTLEVNYFPLNIGLNAEGDRMQTEFGSDIRIFARDLPLQVADPFIPGLSDISGFADGEIVIEGKPSEKINYSGKLEIDKVKALLESTNLYYNASGMISFENDEIKIDGIDILNVKEDTRLNRRGRGKITGNVQLEDFAPEYMDIDISADRLLVLKNETQYTMPFVYGDFIISTGNRNLNFSGTLEKPELTGDISVNYAKLNMPEMKEQISVKTRLSYKYMRDKVRITQTTRYDTLNKEVLEPESESENGGEEADIADLINYDINIGIDGPFEVNMDLGLLGKMYAVIGTKIGARSLRYVKNRNNENARFFAELEVKEPSTITTYRQFSTTGTITFPTGNIENPALDLKAVYENTMSSGASRRPFRVIMFITGTKETPDVRFTYFIDGQEATGDESQIKENAIYLLVRNSLKGEGGGGNIAESVGSGGAGMLLSKGLTDFLLGTGVISSADVDFKGDAFDETTVTLTGRLFGGVTWTIGGNLSDLQNNNEISIDVPISTWTESDFWSNLVIQLTSSTSADIINSYDSKIWEIKMKTGKTW